MFTIDEFLNSYIKDTGISKKELAKKLGLHTNTLRNWLSCRCYPSMDSTQDALSKLGYDVIVVEKKDRSVQSAKSKPVCCFDNYDKALYDRGRKSVYTDLSNKLEPVIKDINEGVKQ